MKSRGKCVVFLISGGAVLVILLAFFGARGIVVESWHIRALSSEDESKVRGAAEHLADLHATRAIPRLLALLEKNDRFASWLPELLSRFAPEVTPALLLALHHDGAHVRSQAALALGRLGPNAASARPKLETLLEDADESVRAAARTALAAIGEK